MRVAVIGTRGIPNHHGGFEQFAEYFSVYLKSRGHEVFVYNSHNHPYKEPAFKEVSILRCYDPEYLIGTAGQFIYDLNCILDSRKRQFDVILQLGYTSSSIWHWLMPKKPVLATNMDGLEWKRSKYSKMVRGFLRKAERLGVKHGGHLISDSVGIQEYIKREYGKSSVYIPYGATIFDTPRKAVLGNYDLNEHSYSMILARLEPENNIETIISAYSKCNLDSPLIVFGKINAYGEKLVEKYGEDSRIRFLGANYNQDDLNNLRYYSRYYFHGHSVGGTNPSLLEAMASNALIIANDNVFNRSILGGNAKYFSSENDILNILNEDDYFNLKERNAVDNLSRISEYYSWEIINRKYESFLLNLTNNH